MRRCPECIYYKRCDIYKECCLTDDEACGSFDSKDNYIKWPCKVMDSIYFIGYGVVEELKAEAMTIEANKSFIDSYIGYVNARRPDGTLEYIGFNVFGELAFLNKEDAEKALNMEVVNED